MITRTHDVDSRGCVIFGIGAFAKRNLPSHPRPGLRALSDIFRARYS